MVRDGDDITLKIVDRRIESTTKIFSQFLTLTAIRKNKEQKEVIYPQTDKNTHPDLPTHNVKLDGTVLFP